MSRRTLTKAAALLVPLAGALAYQGFAPEETLAADSSNILTIQGRLTTGGTPVNSTLALTFEIHQTPTGGAASFAEVHTNVVVKQGVFSVQLGSLSGAGGVPLSAFQPAGDRYVAVRLGGVEVVNPRIRLSAVPFAFQALNASSGGITEINGVNASSYLITVASGSGLSVDPTANGIELGFTPAGVLTVNGVQPALGDLTLNGTLGEIEVATGTNSLTFSLNGGVIQTLNGLPAAGGDFDVTGGTGITVTNGANSIEISRSGAAVETLNGKSGAVTIDAAASSGVTVDNAGSTIRLSLDLSSAVASVNGKAGNVTIEAANNGGVIVDNTGSNVQVSLDPTNAVLDVNGKTGSVVITGGTGVSVDNSGPDIVLSATTSAGGAALPNVAGGRLTLSPTNALIDQLSASSTLYYLPYRSNLVSLYDGSSWGYETFASVSVAAPGVGSTNYDVYLYKNGPSLALELVPWASNTSRTAVLQTQDGTDVKPGDPTRRYLGTVRTNTAGTFSDEPSRRFVWNRDNRVAWADFTERSGGPYTSSSLGGTPWQGISVQERVVGKPDLVEGHGVITTNTTTAAALTNAKVFFSLGQGSLPSFGSYPRVDSDNTFVATSSIDGPTTILRTRRSGYVWIVPCTSTSGGGIVTFGSGGSFSLRFHR